MVTVSEKLKSLSKDTETIKDRNSRPQKSTSEKEKSTTWS